MADSAPDRSNDFNTKIVDEFRANEGRVGDPFAGTPMILIHHIGAKSGIEADARFAYCPSRGRRPPSWLAVDDVAWPGQGTFFQDGRP